MELMEDPVLTEDRQTYERAAIVDWLRTHDTSPSTGATLSSKHLIPNVAIRSLVREWKEKAGRA